VMDIPVRESIKLTGRTKRRKRSRDDADEVRNDTRICNASRMSGVLSQSPHSWLAAFPEVSRILCDSLGPPTSWPTWRRAEAKSDRQIDICKMSFDMHIRCLWSPSESSNSSSSYSTTLPPLLSTAAPRFRRKSFGLSAIFRLFILTLPVLSKVLVVDGGLSLSGLRCLHDDGWDFWLLRSLLESCLA
jgi:hypothetical protein